jgi:hypothetical protein
MTSCWLVATWIVRAQAKRRIIMAEGLGVAGRLRLSQMHTPIFSPATLGNGTKSFKPKRPKNHIGSCPRGRKNGLAGFFRAQKLTIPRFWRSSRVPNVLCGRPLFAAAAAVESGRLCTLTSWESHGGRCGWTLGGWSSIRGACELLEGY